MRRVDVKFYDLPHDTWYIFQVWDYPDYMEYHDGQELSALFGGYINFFLKGKVEATGWPQHVKTEADKAKFVADYYNHEGIHLNPTNMRKNPGRRTQSKLMLNSFW